MNKIAFVLSILIILFIFGCFNKEQYQSNEIAEESRIAASDNITNEITYDNYTFASDNLSDNLLVDNKIDNISLIQIPEKNKKLMSDKIILSNKNLHVINPKQNLIRNKDIAGTYKITFFGSQVTNVRNTAFGGSVADMYYISNDCKIAQKLYPAIVNNGIKNQCSLLTQSEILDGIVTISYDENNYLHIKSRIQLEGGIVDMSVNDKYQYTTYNPISDSLLLKGTGVTNWTYDNINNMPSSNSTVFVESPFQVTMLGSNILRLDITLVGKNIKVMSKSMTIDAVNTLLLEKIDSKPIWLENRIQKKFSKR